MNADDIKAGDLLVARDNIDTHTLLCWERNHCEMSPAPAGFVV